MAAKDLQSGVVRHPTADADLGFIHHPQASRDQISLISQRISSETAQLGEYAMADDQARRGVLLDVAARGMVPVLGGCAGALAGGPEGGVIGVVVGQVVEKAINYFGENIVVGWHAFFGGKPPAERIAALAELASLTPEQARQQADQLFDEMRLDVRPEDRAVAVEYLSALPRAVDRAILRDERTGAVSLSLSVGLDKPEDMLALLPTDVPPYRVPGELPGSPYRLESLLGSGGFGAVYKASSASLQHLPLAVKVCLDPAMSESLKAERDNLERLMKAGHAEGAKRVVKLYGYDLDRSRPYLVYEYIPGGDLTQHLTRQRAQLGRNLKPAEVLLLMVQVVEGLVFAHRHGLIHRDLKPANILVDGETLKLADFGLGSVCATRAVMTSRIGMSTVGQLSFADQVSLFRGAGTPLYMSPEQRKGGMPDPKHDLYSLGVMWFQLLTGDVTRELHAGWAKELVVKYSVPRDHIDMIERCVGWFDERPKDAGELLALLKSLGEKLVPAPAEVRPPPVPMLSISSHDPVRRDKLQIWLGRLQDAHKAIQSGARPFKHWVTCALIWLGALMVVTGACIIPLESLRIPRNETNGVFVALFILGLSSVAAWLVDLKLTRRRRDQQQAALDEAIQTLKTEYPVEVAQWGGEATLREAALVGPIVELHRLGGIVDTAAEEYAGSRESAVEQGRVAVAQGVARQPPAETRRGAQWTRSTDATAPWCDHADRVGGRLAGGLALWRGHLLADESDLRLPESRWVSAVPHPTVLGGAGHGLPRLWGDGRHLARPARGPAQCGSQSGHRVREGIDR
jgi:serine/threonine protein kinase